MKERAAIAKDVAWSYYEAGVRAVRDNALFEGRASKTEFEKIWNRHGPEYGAEPGDGS